MARFSSTMTSTEEAINRLADLANFLGQRTRTARTAGEATLTAAQHVNGIISQAGTPGAFSLTMPTAALIVAAIPNCQIGSSYEFIIVNHGDGAITVVIGSGMTLIGDADTVPVNHALHYRGIVTAVDTPAVDLVSTLTDEMLQDLDVS